MPFIVLEGVDGAGKSTQLGKLREMLSHRGEQSEFLHFPRFDAPVYGELIARFLRGELGALDRVDPYLVALIYAGDRADAAPTIRRWLDEGKWVVTDRFVYSNIAYQCAKIEGKEQRDALRDWIFELEFGYNKLPRPDVSVLLDVPFEFTRGRLGAGREGDDRSYLRGGSDIHEQSLELQRRVREVYLSCAEKDERFRVVDCSDGQGNMASPDVIFSKIELLISDII